MSPARVLVTDAQPLFAELVARALDRHPDIAVEQERPASAAEAIQAAIARKPDVVLLDFWMPDMRGLQSTAQITAWVPRCKVLVLSWLHGPAEIQGALAAGAAGFLPKSIRAEQLVEAVLKAKAGEFPVLGAELERLVDRLQMRQAFSHAGWQQLNTLTPREKQVLGLLSLGLPASGISKRLFLATSTINEHVHNILRKLEVSSSAQAVALARKVGLVQSSPSSVIP